MRPPVEDVATPHGEDRHPRHEGPEAGVAPPADERTGVPSATGNSWQSAPQIVAVSQPRVKKWVTPAT